MFRFMFYHLLWPYNLTLNVSYPECNAAIHKKCIDKIIGRCTGTAANSRDTMVGDFRTSKSVS